GAGGAGRAGARRRGGGSGPGGVSGRWGGAARSPVFLKRDTRGPPPPPLGGGGGGGGARARSIFLRAPSLSLPRKRGRGRRSRACLPVVTDARLPARLAKAQRSRYQSALITPQ